MAKSMKQKRDEAMMRLIAYEARTTEQQLNKISGRPGKSKKEVMKLKARLETEKPSKKKTVKEPKEKKVVVENKPRKKFKKGIKKIKKD